MTDFEQQVIFDHLGRVVATYTQPEEVMVMGGCDCVVATYRPPKSWVEVNPFRESEPRCGPSRTSMYSMPYDLGLSAELYNAGALDDEGLVPGELMSLWPMVVCLGLAVYTGVFVGWWAGALTALGVIVATAVLLAGHRPPKADPLPTKLDRAKGDYAAGRITVEEFEERAGSLLADGTAELPAKPEGPPEDPSNRSTRASKLPPAPPRIRVEPGRR